MFCLHSCLEGIVHGLIVVAQLPNPKVFGCMGPSVEDCIVSHNGVEEERATLGNNSGNGGKSSQDLMPSLTSVPVWPVLKDSVSSAH